MMQQMQFNITSDLNKMKSDISSISHRVSTCEANINSHEYDLYSNGGLINYKLRELTQSMERLGEQILQLKHHMNMLEIIINDLKAQYEVTASQLRPETNATPVEPKEKSDLEIFEPNIDDDIKHYVDLDLITEPNYRIGIFDDDNWYDLQ